jgi:hypothetical protein
MCTHGGMEPGMCGSRSVSSSSTAAAADEWRMLLLGSDSLRCAISGMATRWCGASLLQVKGEGSGFELDWTRLRLCHASGSRLPQLLDRR